MEEFSSLDIVEILNIPRERLREWLKRRFIRPSVQKSRCQGHKSLFSREDLYKITLFRDLIEDNGMGRSTAASCIHSIEKENFSKLKYAIIAYNRWRHLLWVNTRTKKIDKAPRHIPAVEFTFLGDQIEKEKIFGMRDKWDSLLILNLEKLRKDVDIIIEK